MRSNSVFTRLTLLTHTKITFYLNNIFNCIFHKSISHYLTMTLLCILLISIATTFNSSQAYKAIKIISRFDLNNYLELELFIVTIPWIAENIGSDIRINFIFLDSPTLMGPRKCALETIKKNLWLQGDYLKCDAYGLFSDDCRILVNIDDRSYNRCLRRKVQRYSKEAQREYKKLKTNNKNPLIILRGKQFLEYTDPQSTLDAICEMFGKRKPERCYNPVSIDGFTMYPDYIDDTTSETTELTGNTDGTSVTTTITVITDDGNSTSQNTDDGTATETSLSTYY